MSIGPISSIDSYQGQLKHSFIPILKNDDYYFYLIWVNLPSSSIP